ncbi:hypothetical protein KY285_030534 [Solanum tuberosum]|nr:hypothetical protein KY285_030534 [Solanum tuberosum]
MNIEDEATGKTRIEVVQLKYDYVPRYCIECKTQGHSKESCKSMNQPPREERDALIGEKRIKVQETEVHSFYKGKAKILSSAKVVGDLANWKVVDKKHHIIEDQNTEKTNQPLVENKFEALNKIPIEKKGIQVSTTSSNKEAQVNNIVTKGRKGISNI